METVIRNVGDLDTQDRSALERVVGHQLRESQQLVIQVVSIVAPPPLATPTAAGAQLPDWCRVYDGLTDAQVDELDQSIARSQSSRDIA
jgi:hypothetical protein